jgi:hypothetical protein
VSVFARIQGLELSVVDCGVSEAVRRSALLARKIAHGTRNSRVTAAMSLDQAHCRDLARHGNRRRVGRARRRSAGIGSSARRGAGHSSVAPDRRKRA